MTSAGEAGTTSRATRFLLPYAEIFRIPRAWRFSVAGIIGRMPMSMGGLGIVLLVSASTGHYGVAGSVSAASALGVAACAPQVARLTDRYGQGRVLPPIAAGYAVSVIGLVLAVTLRAPDWTWFLPGTLAGATMPSLGPMSRARWSALLAGSPRLHAAFSLESVADEVCFVVGPAAVTILSTQVHPAAGIGAAAVLGLAGTMWFSAQRATEPPLAGLAPETVTGAGTNAGGAAAAPAGADAAAIDTAGTDTAGVGRAGPAPAAGGRWAGRLAAPALVVIVPAYLFLGSMFVAVDLSTVAFATALGHKPLSGLILGVYALGSATGGLWYGSRTWRQPASRRFTVTLALTVAGVCTFWAMPNLVLLTVLIYLCGMTIAPTLIAGYSIIESTARPGRTTEAMSWLSTGIGIGVACGSTAAGFILDALGPRWGYGFAASCGVATLAVALAGATFTRSLRSA
ncbi:MAG TPA: MFS transporter [Trebonia sp.]|jgi:hypothetical protein|nr:MFS transporter [Trebonia sp.]